MNEKIKIITHNDQIDNNERHKGTLKIFLGYAPGVGKTYSMLNEANRRKKRGQDVVIGCIDCHDRTDTLTQIHDIEVIPRKKVNYNNKVFEELDIEAIICRKPYCVLIDELAHSNISGTKNKKRYEDVQEITNSGINVLCTLNIQHLESLNDIVRHITGITINETVPDKIIENANEVVIVDITPDALLSRLDRGKICNPQNIERSYKNFFRRGNLNALREIALRQAAQEVDEDLEEYMKEHGIKENWYTVERVMVCISSSPSARKLIRRGARIAKRYKSEWTVVAVDCTNIFAPQLSENDTKMLLGHFKLAKQLGADTITLKGKSISRELVNYATEKHITQIVIGHSKRTKWQTLLRGSTISKLLNETKNIEVHVIPNEQLI